MCPSIPTTEKALSEVSDGSIFKFPGSIIESGYFSGLLIISLSNMTSFPWLLFLPFSLNDTRPSNNRTSTSGCISETAFIRYKAATSTVLPGLTYQYRVWLPCLSTLRPFGLPWLSKATDKGASISRLTGSLLADMYLHIRFFASANWRITGGGSFTGNPQLADLFAQPMSRISHRSAADISDLIPARIMFFIGCPIGMRYTLLAVTT